MNRLALFGRTLGALALGFATLGAVPDAGARALGPVLASHDWLNGAPTASSLGGNVVIVDVFTFGCFNCKNVTPNLRALNKQHGVKILGIHSPETPYEQDRQNVVANLASLGVVWPVAVDNDFALWKSYGVSAWPTQLIFDKHGHLRRTVVGDSQDADVDATVKALLAES